ncbi:MAG TPA: NAD(P)-dependent oxidoreductase [Acidimicrobiia bacterium]|nr:NAD(P)-dependent oxidoreductase [Acidimicrobiia bacterium]
MNKVVVTGGSGKAGRAVVNELNERGYQTLNVDQTIPPASWGWALAADLTDLGQTYEALRGADAVVHLAAIPAPEMRPEQETFRNNILSTYNVFSAAADLGLEKVVWASSETVLGLPFEKELPDYAPIDEQQTPYPESSYALSKLLGEQMAAQFNRRFALPFAGLRISNIMEPDEYAKFPNFWDDPTIRKWNLWGYVDVRDVAQATRLALQLDVPGSEQYIVAATDTVMNRSSQGLMEEVFPTVEIRRDLGEFETLLSIDKARQVLGYEPDYSWRDHL